MKNLSFIMIMGLLFLAAPSPAFAKVNVFACEPEWAALAQEIGGDTVLVKSATHARQDPHHIRARPSLLAAMRRADLVICTGAGLEMGWLPILLQKSGKPSVQPGEVGYLMAADKLRLLEKPVVVDRSMGDIHPQGNPHIHLNPHSILKVAKTLKTRLQQIDPDQGEHYDRNYQRFALQWSQAIKKWEHRAASLRGQKIVVHHRSWSYLIDWLGLELVATLEAKPGIPPSAAHLRTVLDKVRTTQLIAIVRTPYASSRASEWLAEKTGVPALVLPYTIGGGDKATNLFALFDETIEMLLEAQNNV